MLRLCLVMMWAYPLVAATPLVLLKTGTPRADPQRGRALTITALSEAIRVKDYGQGRMEFE